MTNGIDDEEADPFFVQAHHIVKIAADVSRRAKERVEVNRPDLRKRLGQEILLQARGQAQLFIDARHVRAERVVAAMQDVQLIAQGVELLLDRY